MLHIGFSRDLAKINFKDRATIEGSRVTYRLADGSGHVGLDAAEWRSLNDELDARSGEVLRKAKKRLFLLFPCIFVYGMTLGQVMPGAGLIIVAGIFLGPPGIYLWQSHRIERISREIEQVLANRSKVVAPPPAPWRVPRWLEIACAVLVGPHLILEVFGSIYPEAYRNTPLLGTSLNWTSLVSFSVIAAIFYFHWRAVQHRPKARSRPQSRAPERPSAVPERPAGRVEPAPRTFGRRVDPVVRDAAP
jgi:hypothetical protein